MVNINKVKQLSKEKGLKISYVCEKLGASRYKLYDWERGKSSPTESELETLANVLETTVEYLTDKTDIKEQKNKTIPNRDSLIEEALSIMDSLPEDAKAAALAQLKALAALSNKKRKK